MKKAGMQYSPTPSAEDTKAWLAAGRKVWEEYAKKDKFCKEMLDIQTGFMKQLGYEL